jgi:hypothetical protein
MFNVIFIVDIVDISDMESCVRAERRKSLGGVLTLGFLLGRIQT